LTNIYLVNGGEVAIDNLTIAQGGIGPWRRDFENGFVLVNPLQQPQTFSAADLAGKLNRTGVHRINGTQAPDVNNGQAVTDSLTLRPFDAIILLLIRFAPRCQITMRRIHPWWEPEGVPDAGQPPVRPSQPLVWSGRVVAQACRKLT
jgi:hypothetical protein